MHTIGIDRFPCNSKLDGIVVPRIKPGGSGPPRQSVTIFLHHAIQHKTFENVNMPEAALEYIREHVSSFPPLITAEVQKRWHDAWGGLSKEPWKIHNNQIILAQGLLKKSNAQVDAWEFPVPEGMHAIGWRMKGISEKLRDQIVEVALDATCR